MTFEEYLEKLNPIIYKTINEYKPSLRMEREDMYQEACLLLFDLVEKLNTMYNFYSYFKAALIYTYKDIRVEEHKQLLHITTSDIITNEDGEEVSKIDLFGDIETELRIIDPWLENYIRYKKEVRKRYYQEHREEILKKTKKYYHENREKVLEYARTYYQENREDIIEYAKKYKREHKEQVKEYRKKYREKHKEQIREYNKRYREEHKEEIRESNKRYREEHREELITKKKERYRQKKLEKMKDYDTSLIGGVES